MSLLIHWHEGLFLQPHHLQRMQRAVFDASVVERKLSWSYPYGVIESRLSRDDLENMRVRFERLRAIMPSGLLVDFPRSAELPSLDIKEAFARSKGEFTVNLAVPLWHSERANTIDVDQIIDHRVKLLYRLQEVEVKDENTGENPKPLLLRRVNARLILDYEDTTDLEVIPLVKIASATGEDIGKPKQDPDFAPPCFVLNGSPLLCELVRELAAQVEASRKELVVQITRGGFSLDMLRGLQIEQMLRLRSLNRYSARLPSLARSPNVSPFSMYLELHELLGELAALHPDRDEFEVSPYNHDNPLFCLRELAHKIRSILKGAVAPSFMRVDFVRDGELMTATFTEEHFAKPNDYFLAIKTQEDPRNLTSLVEDPDRFKCMASSFAMRPIRGLKLKEERIPPMELPAQADMHYYRILRRESGRMWQMLEQEKSAAIRWPGMENSDFRITLYMTTPNQGKES